jgi:hypothetical protein
MTRAWAVFACIPLATAVSACSKRDRGDASATGSETHTPTATAPPIDAPEMPAIAVPYSLPSAKNVAKLPAKPAAYVFVLAGGGMRVGASPSLAAATEVANIDSLLKLVPPDPAKAAAAPAIDAGTIGLGAIGTLDGRSGAGFGGSGSGYGIGGGGGTYVAYSMRGARTDPAAARIVLVADRQTSIDAIATVVKALGEPIAVAVKGDPVDGALAVTLEAGTPSDGAQYTVTLFSTGANIVQVNAFGLQQVPAGANGMIDTDALAKMVGEIDASATVSLDLNIHAMFADLVVGLDAAASRKHPIPVRVRAGGSMYGHNAKVPQVRIGQPNTVGDLDKAIIRRYIKRNIQKITYCYEKELTAKKDLEGTVVAEFVIDSNGHVVQAKGSGMNDRAADCIADVIHRIEFPKPKGGIVKVTYPFTFRPAGG